MPTKMSGVSSHQTPGLPLNALKKTAPANAARMNRMPPVKLHLQATIRIAMRIKAGMLCITKQTNLSLNDPLSKQSNEKTTKKRIASKANTRAVQMINFLFI